MKFSRSHCVVFGAMLLFVSTIADAARFAEPVDDVARVYDAIDARLNLMDDVAAWKWSKEQAIVDDARERVVMEQTIARANELGLASEPVRRVITIQVQMARAIQTQHFEEWRQNGFPASRTIRDLTSDLRPALDSVTQEFLVALFWAQGEFQQVGASDVITKSLRRIASYPGVTARDLSELRAALQDVRANANSIDVGARLHVLRIGTTGDYAPFSVEHAGNLRGLDIEMAEELAAHLDLKPRFIHTSWSNLMNDLDSGRFDLAISGISNTPERAARAEFSTAYHFDGKTAIARCQDRGRFTSLSDIDRSDVKLIVNAGGTNQQFVHDHIERAQVIVQQDNRAVFDEIIAGRADVMITDAIEVDLQTRKHKELCRTLSGTLTNSAKAILLRRGSPLTKTVDQWLQSEVARGAIEEKLERAMKVEAEDQ